MGVCINPISTPKQVQALAEFVLVFANPEFVYETEKRLKETTAGTLQNQSEKHLEQTSC